MIENVNSFWTISIASEWLARAKKSEAGSHENERNWEPRAYCGGVASICGAHKSRSIQAQKHFLNTTCSITLCRHVVVLSLSIQFRCVLFCVCVCVLTTTSLPSLSIDRLCFWATEIIIEIGSATETDWPFIYACIFAAHLHVVEKKIDSFEMEEHNEAKRKCNQKFCRWNAFWWAINKSLQFLFNYFNT